MNSKTNNNRRVEELRYSIERNNFILSILTARILVILYADGVGEPDSQTSIIEQINPQYVDLVRSLRNRFPNDSPEDLAQELYNMVYIEDNNGERDYSHFRTFDEPLLNDWHLMRERQAKLFSERVAVDSILTDAQHAYYKAYGRDIEWREINENKELDEETLDEFEVKKIREKLLCQMYKNGTIDDRTAMDYMGDSHMSLGAFLKIVEMHTSEEEEGEA